jgi:hypothetical protein
MATKMRDNINYLVAWFLKLKAAIYPLLKCSSGGIVLLKRVDNALVELTARIDSTKHFYFSTTHQESIERFIEVQAFSHS